MQFEITPTGVVRLKAETATDCLWLSSVEDKWPYISAKGPHLSISFREINLTELKAKVAEIADMLEPPTKRELL